MKKGSRFKMQDGEIAVYIGKDTELKRPLLFRVGNTLITRQKDGRHCEKCDGVVYPAVFLNQEIKGEDNAGA